MGWGGFRRGVAIKEAASETKIGKEATLSDKLRN